MSQTDWLDNCAGGPVTEDTLQSRRDCTHITRQHWFTYDSHSRIFADGFRDL